MSKSAPRKATKATKSSAGSAERKKGLFPYYNLQESMKVASAIKDQHGGKPMNRILLAKALDLSPGGSTFRLMVISANKYGLTSGDPYKGAAITIEEAGQAIVSPRSDTERQRALVQAAMKPPLLGRFYAEFNNEKVPRADLAKNKLERDYGIPVSQSEELFALLLENAKFVGILQEVQGNQWIMFDQDTLVVPVVKIEGEEPPVQDDTSRVKPEVTPHVPPAPEGVHSVFIAHGKNKRLLEQVKQIVEFGKFSAVVSEERETTAIPVPDKVIADMHLCQAGIIIVSADEKVRDTEGKEVYKINDNVLIEIGAATVLYRKKVILLWDKRIAVPSNLGGLYRCEFEGDTLDWDSGLKLQRTLTEFSR